MIPATPPSAPAAPPEAEFERWLRLDPSGFVRLVRLCTHWVWDHVFQLESHGAERVPASGRVLFVPNHSSYMDPFLQMRGQHRVARFMAKSQLFEMPVLGWIVRNGGGFPVRRGRGDTFAMELARRLLLDDQPVVVYAEGTRFRTSLPLGPPKSGAARLALETGAPVVPVASWGVKEGQLYGRPRWRRPKVTTLYGEPLRFDGLEPTPENVERARDEIWAAVTSLYEDVRELAAAR